MMKAEIYSHINQIEAKHWWYVARREIIFDWVLQVLARYQTPRILDIGCGTGYNIAHLKQHGYDDVWGLDFSPQALEFCRGRKLTLLVCADGAEAPFAGKTFDVVMALDMIEHIEDDVRALTTLTRVLKPGGTLIIFTPAFQFLWSLQDEVSHHYRRYTASELKRKLGQAGLVPTKLTYANTFLFPAIWSGRMILRLVGDRVKVTSENDLHPGWSNRLLERLFAAERPLLRLIDFPFGVSLLCVAEKRAAS